MRKSDIWQAKQNPSYVRTESMVRVKLDNVDAMCDEITQAARMMGGAV